MKNRCRYRVNRALRASLVLLLALPLPLVADDRQAPSSQAALGLSVLDRGISLWRIRSKTMWGLELDELEATRARLLFNVGSTSKDHTVRFRSALTRKRLASPDKVTRFSYQTGYTRLFYNRFDNDDVIYFWSAGVEMGVGALWRPLKTVSVSLRQGLAVEYQYRERDWATRPEDGRVNTTKRLLLRMPSPRLLVLINF